MKTYQRIVAYVALSVAFVCWLVVLITSDAMLGSINLIWLGFMVSWSVLLFIVIADAVDD